MLEREVLKVDIDNNGNIIAFRNQFKGWSPVSIEDAIKHIEGNLYTYYAKFPNFGRIDLQVVIENNNKSIKTDTYKTSRNLLKDLPSYTLKNMF